MNTDMTWQYDSPNLEATETIGYEMGALLKGGEIIELVSDLGGGKTAFVRGLAKGAGSKDTVSSPSFTISKEYVTDSLVIHHYDFYRLDDAGIMSDELIDVMSDKRNVVVIEWGGIVDEILPVDKLTITISKTSDTSRQLVCNAGGVNALRLKVNT